ncbi:MAG: alpha/beta hydrolase [Bacteroidota bacterium]
MRYLLGLFCLLSSIHIYAQPRHITVDGTKIWVKTLGTEDRKPGQPVIVFENGHGVPLDNWDKVVDDVAALAPVVAYDRAGIGQSEAVDEKPTMENVANRLVRILQVLELEPPYVLVGHSLGGMYVRGFPMYYPDLLAGLVIVDPADFTETHENKRDYYTVLNWEEQKVDSLIQHFIDRRNRGHDKELTPVGREGQYLEEVRAAEFKEIMEHQLPNIPVHMITGGRFDMPEKFRSKDYDHEALFRSKIKHRSSRWIDVIQTVDKGMFFYSGDAGHYVQWDDPGLVVASIKLVLSDYEVLKQKK